MSQHAPAAAAASAKDSDAARADNAHLKLAAARGLCRVHAAIYVGVSPTKFDEMVRDRRMPKPKCVDARRLWDRRALDLAFEALPDEGGEPKGSSWEGLA